MKNKDHFALKERDAFRGLPYYQVFGFVLPCIVWSQGKCKITNNYEQVWTNNIDTDHSDI